MRSATSTSCISLELNVSRIFPDRTLDACIGRDNERDIELDEAIEFILEFREEGFY
jgi:hypothetical protein